MLQALLAEIRGGGAFDLGGLASRLGTTSEMVAAALDHLQRTGHLRGYRLCDDGCQGCGLGEVCRSSPGQDPARRTPQLFVWTSTPKP